MIKKYIVSLLSLLLFQIGNAQEDVLSFSEYLGYIKKYHPIVKQANLLISESEAKLLKARGAFDPKLEVNHQQKEFKNATYFDRLNSSFKIPTWYGLALKGNLEQNTGVNLNPEAQLPEEGLYSVGISFSLAKGLLINERMATLKQAKLFQKQAEVDNQLLVNNILFEASKAYFTWLKTFQEKKVFEEFLANAAMRLESVKRNFELGDKPAIDITEAKIAFNNRKLNLEKAKLSYLKASLALSNFLWIESVPVEVTANLRPDVQIQFYIDKELQINRLTATPNLTNHPKLKSLAFKYQGLEVERRLNQNNLLPKIDLQYNVLSNAPKTLSTFNVENYKTGLSINFPLFLRKERANLKLTNFKLQALAYDRQATTLRIKNKLNSVQQEIRSYQNQITLADTMVSDYSVLLKGEERKFDIGESSLFLINAREVKLIENKLKVIELENALLKAKGKLFNTLGIELLNGQG